MRLKIIIIVQNTSLWLISLCQYTRILIPSSSIYLLSLWADKEIILTSNFLNLCDLLCIIFLSRPIFFFFFQNAHFCSLSAFFLSPISSSLMRIFSSQQTQKLKHLQFQILFHRLSFCLFHHRTLMFLVTY